MENIIVRCVDSHNVYGNMNLGLMCDKNGYAREIAITESDKKILMNMHNLRSDELMEYKLDASDKRLLLNEHRKAFAAAEGINWGTMYTVDQGDKSGTYYNLDEEHIIENPTGWTDHPEDILVFDTKIVANNDKIDSVLVGHQVGDTPVLMLEDRKKGVVGIAHCMAPYVNYGIVRYTVEALKNQFDSKIEDIHATIGVFASEGWIYDCWPNWAKDAGFWEESRGIEPMDNGNYEISFRNAIMYDLLQSGIEMENITFLPGNTITDETRYSHIAGRDGRQFVGLAVQKVKTR